MRCFPPSPPHPPIQCWNSGEIAITRVQHCRRGEGEGLNKCRWICLARVKKRHKCKFVPRLLFMIVGFLFPLQDGLSVMKSPVVMASITHSCLQLMQHYLFSALSLFISDWLKFLFDWIPRALLSPYKTCKTVGLIPNRLQLWFREHFRKRELSVHSCFLMVFQKLFFFMQDKMFLDVKNGKWILFLPTKHRRASVNSL